ncbi:hypothetical protein G9A89_002329 [Geosiphon pyriformis]|nr:hypothetical protein G9A89_002329 [Geosiphon pyriformis]
MIELFTSKLVHVCAILNVLACTQTEYLVNSDEAPVYWYDHQSGNMEKNYIDINENFKKDTIDTPIVIVDDLTFSWPSKTEQKLKSVPFYVTQETVMPVVFIDDLAFQKRKEYQRPRVISSLYENSSIYDIDSIYKGNQHFSSDSNFSHVQQNDNSTNPSDEENSAASPDPESADDIPILFIDDLSYFQQIDAKKSSFHSKRNPQNYNSAFRFAAKKLRDINPKVFSARKFKHPNRRNYELVNELAYFINERQRIFLKKSRGEKPPFTNDFALATYRFTNVFREDDRASRIIFNLLSKNTLDDLNYIPNLILHRLVSRPIINESLGYVTNIKKAWKAMERRQKRGLPISTSAFQSTLSWKERYEQWLKVFENGNDLFQAIIERNPKPTLADAYIVLLDDKRIPQIGTFTAWQIAADMYMMNLITYGENKDYAVLGPGARQGLKLFGNISLSCLLKKVNQKLGNHFQGRKLKGLDLEHMLCEFQKYKKVINGEFSGLRLLETVDRK